jgi:hypothetical protein
MESPNFGKFGYNVITQSPFIVQPSVKCNRSGGRRRTCSLFVQNTRQLSEQAGSMFYNYQTR